MNVENDRLGIIFHTIIGESLKGYEIRCGSFGMNWSKPALKNRLFFQY